MVKPEYNEILSGHNHVNCQRRSNRRNYYNEYKEDRKDL